MKALILNSGIGSRMGTLTQQKNKCMVEIADGLTILDIQVQNIMASGLTEIVMTTGSFADVLESYAAKTYPDIKWTFVRNPIYEETNYIYSIELAKEALQDSIISMHGDLVFEASVLKDMVHRAESTMVISTTQALPEKDFKAVIQHEKIEGIGIDLFENAVAAQPLYKLNWEDWRIWLDEIIAFGRQGNRKVYAENAFNRISSQIRILPFDIENRFCMEVDTQEDLERARSLYTHTVSSVQ